MWKKNESEEPLVATDPVVRRTSTVPAATTSTTSTRAVVDSGSSAIIGPTVLIKGEISGSEDLLIRGTVEGSISLPDNFLTVGDKGQLRADVVAREIRIDGEVQGDLTGNEKLVISSSGRVRGNISAPRVVLEEGCRFKGSIDMDFDTAAAPATSRDSGIASVSSVAAVETKAKVFKS